VIDIREEAMTEKVQNTLKGQCYAFLSDSTLPALPALSFYRTGSSNLPLNCARVLFTYILIVISRNMSGNGSQLVNTQSCNPHAGVRLQRTPYVCILKS